MLFHFWPLTKRQDTVAEFVALRFYIQQHLSSEFTFVFVFDTELQNVIFSYPEKQPAWEKSVVLQCLSGLISSADALEEARATSRTTRGENAPH